MEQESAIGEINSLTRSHHRVQILTWLLEEGQLSVWELRDRVDASRTTVNRNLEALENQGWIYRRHREVTLLPPGELVVQKLLEIVRLVHISDHLQPIARWLPPTVLDIDADTLGGATVVTPDSTDPYAPVARHIEAMDSTEEFRCVLPAVGLQAMKSAHSRVVDAGCSQEVVVDEGILETLTTNPIYRSLLDEMLASGRLELFVSAVECRYYLGLADSVVQIGVEDGDGVPRGLIELASPAGRRWAERVYEQHKNRSRPFVQVDREESVVP